MTDPRVDSPARPRNVGGDIRWALRRAWFFACAYSVVAVAGSAQNGWEVVSGFPLSLPVLIGAYFAGATTTGVIVGLLRPAARTLLGAIVIGVVAALPLAVMIALLAGDASWPPPRRALERVAIITVVWGVGGTLAFRWLARKQTADRDLR